MKLFRKDNTEGYSQEQIDYFNKMWEQFVAENDLKEYTDEYDFEAKAFRKRAARVASGFFNF